MGISEVNNSGIPVQPSQARKIKDDREAEESSKDKVHVSDEARSLYETERSKKLSEIQNKIDQGFYSKREVIEKVADAMLQDLKKQSTD